MQIRKYCLKGVGCHYNWITHFIDTRYVSIKKCTCSGTLVKRMLTFQAWISCFFSIQFLFGDKFPKVTTWFQISPKKFIVQQMGKNPMQSAGCWGICAAILRNPNCIIEHLDFSVSSCLLGLFLRGWWMAHYS